MPLEPLPWDRKDFFKERKHERSSSDSLGPSSVSRWRDNGPHHNGSSRWSSADFRRPFGHGKQGGGWHKIPEDSGSRGGGEGKHARRENRASFSGQKEWKGYPCETTASPNGNFLPHSDFVNSWDQLHSNEQDDKNGGVSNTCQRVERENSLGSIGWKPLKWPRSGSLPSRGSSFSHSSSSKNMGVDSVETKVDDAQLNNLTPVLPPSGDASGCFTSGGPAEDNSSRKKPRLGWGEGLAKYEKKKVDGPDEAAPKEIAVTEIEEKVSMSDGASNLETLHSNLANVMKKSPRLTGFSECASPATPSSVTCSSSPGVEEKSCSKTSSFHNGVCNPISPNCTVSTNHSEGLAFNLENLDLSQFANLTSSLTELLQSDDLGPGDSGFLRSTSMNKLLVWKADISKTLEVTESEIDSLENELKLLVSKVVSRPFPVNVFSGDIVMEKMQDEHKEERDGVKDEDIYSPCSTTCTSFGTYPMDVGVSHREDIVYETVLASNREFVNRASELINKLLPTNEMSFPISRTATVELHVRENFAMKKRRRKFKDKAISLKFRAFHHLWKEDLRLLSMRRYRAKAQKKYDMSSRFVYNGYQKHRSSIHSRFSSPAGNLSLIPSSEIISYTNKLLSDPHVKIHRDSLKMPALILDKETIVSKFISDNGLVEDPCAVEKERSMDNPWTPQEKDTFLNKLSTFGKDFKTIASFLDHKTIADCVEFYYKNHKSDSFQKIKKSEFTRKAKAYSTNTYMVTSGKIWNREWNAASLDMLGAVSEIAANADNCLENKQKCTARFFIGTAREFKKPRGDDVIPVRASSVDDAFGNERETAAADVLAGICGSISSEAMSSCITNSVDPGDGKRAGGSLKSVVDYETCSDESCGEEMDDSNWTDEEKSRFVQAVASYGKDFAMISSCMRTRSRDQCKVYFSKARKCLGLDVIHPEPCNVESGGGNGGSENDGEDACMVGTDSTKVSSSCCKTEKQDLQLSDLKVENTDSASDEDLNLQPDLNQLENKKDVELRSDSLVLPNDSEVEEKPKIDIFSVRNTDNGTSEVVYKVNGTKEDAKAIKAQENEDIRHAMLEEVAFGTERNGHGLHSTSVFDVKKESIGEVNGKMICPAGDLDSIDQKVAMEMDTRQKKPLVISLDRDSCSQASNSSPHDTNVVHHRKALSLDTSSSKLDFLKNTDRRSQRKSASTDGYYQHLPMNSLLDRVESSQILRGHPVTLSNKNVMIGDVGCNEPSSSMQSVSNLEYLSRNSFLQKCNGAKHNGFMTDLPFLSCEQKQSSPSEVEKPCGTGDVKLFGQILSNPSSQQPKPSCSSSTHENEEKGTHRLKMNGGGKSFNLKFGDSQNIDMNSFLPKFEQDTFPSVVENKSLSLRSYGFWDGTRIRTGLSSLPDSAVLLAKYPAAFGNCPTPLSKMESQQLNPFVSSNERGLNGASVFPTRELNGGSSSSCSRLPEYQIYRSRDLTKVVQPFTVDQLRQDFLTQVKRRKEIELSSSINQQQGRRNIIGLNLGGGRGGGRERGVLVNGLCNGVSDPVAAIKMHYAKTEQYGGNIREDESWRGSRSGESPV